MTVPASPAAPHVESGHRYGYVAAGFGLLVPERAVSEVLVTSTLFALPMAPHWIMGALNVRGNIVPVINLRSLLAQTPSPATTTLLLLDQGMWMAGLAVDTLPRAVKPAPARMPAQTLPRTMRDYLLYAGHAAGVDWWEFDHRACLARLAQTHDEGLSHADAVTN